MRQDKQPRNEQGQCHGCWETYYGGGSYSKGNYLNNQRIGYWEAGTGNTSFRFYKKYYAR
jgi:hypothetical protein